MDRPRGARLRPQERLTTGSHYRRVFRHGIRLDGPFFLLVAAPTTDGVSRLGVAVGRKLGGAVARNRIKRLLRECFRRHKGLGFDLVFLPKRELARGTFAEVEREYKRRLGRLEKERRGRPAPDRPH